MEKYSTAEDSLKHSGTKGIIILGNNNSKIGTKNSFDLMQELFVNAGRNTGATVISAAAGTQFALEESGLKKGVFTLTSLLVVLYIWRKVVLRMVYSPIAY